MIVIKKSKTADTRTCDFSKVTREQLYGSSLQHIDDVRKGIEFFIQKLEEAARSHDHDKLSDIQGFHNDFVTGFDKVDWWNKHKLVNRHHLMDEQGIPYNVNLIDVLEMVTDCVMAGMGRSGSVYPLELSPDLLTKAFNNTVFLLKENVKVEDK